MLQNCRVYLLRICKNYNELYHEKTRFSIIYVRTTLAQPRNLIIAFVVRCFNSKIDVYVLCNILILKAVTYLSLVMRKPAFCICENKDADQLSGNREADQRLCFRYIDSTIPLLSKYEISSL